MNGWDDEPAEDLKLPWPTGDGPLLLLDVDGPLNPFEAKPTRRPQGYTTHRFHPYRVWLNPEHGPTLLRFARDYGMTLAWCTTWEHAANTLIGPAIGLPPLPVVEFGFTGTRWKYGPVAELCKGRPVAWFDDDFAARELRPFRDWFDHERRGTATLLRHVDPRIGLKPADLEAVATWLREEVRG